MQQTIKMLALFTLVAASTLLATPARASWWNDDASRVSVYNFNINRMQGGWHDWIVFINDPANNLPRPDILLVQDMPSEADRQNFQDHLAHHFGGTYYGRGNSTGHHTAVIWRASRFDNPSSRSWGGFGDPNPDDGVSQCVDSPDFSTGESINGSPATHVRLFDNRGQRWVSAVSFKTSPHSPNTCPWDNIKKTNWRFADSGWGGALLIMGTDANAPDRNGPGDWTCWYRGTNYRTLDGTTVRTGCDGDNNKGYVDPIYQLCAAQADLYGCLNNNDTHADDRIDYIFGKRGDGTAPGTSHEGTMDRGNSAGQYSDHRAIRSMLYY